MSTELPTRRGSRLYQNLDVSSKARDPNDGEALVFDKAAGLWVPRSVQVSIEPGDIPEGSISEIHLANSAVSTRTVQGGAITSAKMAPNSVGVTQLMDNSVTDVKVGNRTVTDAESMNTSSIYNTGGLTTLLSRLATKVKEIIGTTNWKSPIPISLTELASHRSRHYTGGADPISPANIGAATTNHSHSNATQAVAGFISPADKLRLDQLGLYWETSNTSQASLSPYATGYTTINGLSVNLSRPGTWLIMVNLQIHLSGAANDWWDIEGQIVYQGGTVIVTGHTLRPVGPANPTSLVLIGTYNQTASGGYVSVRARNNYPHSAGGFTATIPNNSNQRIVAQWLG